MQVMGAMLPGKTVMYVLPQAPAGPMGTQWWTIDVMKWMMAMRQGGEVVGKLIRDVPPGLTECRTQMATFLEEVRASAGGIPYSKIMLSGFSQGAITAMDVALSLPTDKAVAGVTVMSGAPIVVEQWAERLKVHTGIKVLVTHGQGDMVLPFVASGWLRDLLQSNGAEVQCMHVPGPFTTLVAMAPSCNTCIYPTPDPNLFCTCAEVTYEQHSGGHELGGPEVIKKIAAHWLRCMM